MPQKDGQVIIWVDFRHTKANKYGVRQGSILGPLLFILVTADLPHYCDTAEVSSILYADDSNCLAIADSQATADKLINTFSTNLAGYSAAAGLCLNENKTQFLQLGGRDKGSSLDFLGVELDSKLSFEAHNTRVLNDIKARIGMIRRLSAYIPRGPILQQIAQAIVIGRLQCAAWITRSVHGLPGSHIRSSPSFTSDVQIALNDLARVLLGVKRSDHIRTSDLADRAGLPTINQLVIRGAATAAWTAANGGPLRHLLLLPDGRTRAAAASLFKPAASSTAAANMAACWQASEDLRNAKTNTAARIAANKLAKSLRFVH